RFSNMRRAGMSRTEVAVGTSRERSMFFAMDLKMPLRGVVPGSGLATGLDRGDSLAFLAGLDAWFCLTGAALAGAEAGAVVAAGAAVAVDLPEVEDCGEAVFLASGVAGVAFSACGPP